MTQLNLVDGSGRPLTAPEESSAEESTSIFTPAPTPVPSVRRAYVPRHDFVTVRPTPRAERVSAGGIFMPDFSTEEVEEGSVLALGPGTTLYDGSVKSLNLYVGARVLYMKHSAIRIGTGDDQVVLVNDSDIRAVVHLLEEEEEEPEASTEETK